MSTGKDTERSFEISSEGTKFLGDFAGFDVLPFVSSFDSLSCDLFFSSLDVFSSVFLSSASWAIVIVALTRAKITENIPSIIYFKKLLLIESILGFTQKLFQLSCLAKRVLFDEASNSKTDIISFFFAVIPKR